MKVKFLNSRQVLARMKRGDCPTYGGGYSIQGFFDDGAKAAPGVMRRLERARLVNYPPASSVSSRWSLVVENGVKA